MDDYTKRLVSCFSEKLDHARLGYIEWDSFKHMALRATFQQCSGIFVQEVYDKYMEQAKMWWDCLVRDVGADPQGRVHYIDMANFIRSATAQTTTYEQLPEFILNLANLVFLMNDRKGDGKWDLEEYRNGAVGWGRRVTDISAVDQAYNSLLSEQDSDGTLSFERYKALVLEFFTSADGQTCARHIFGPMELASAQLAMTPMSKQ